MADGFAIELDGQISVSCVGPTEVAAQVNGLVTMFNVMVYEHTTPEHINDAWHQCVMHVPDRKVAVVPVTIERKRGH